MPTACDECLGRTCLLGLLGRHLELKRAQVLELLGLPDGELIAALTRAADRAEVRRRYEQACEVQVPELRQRASAAGVELLCHCDPRYPGKLLELEAPPRVLHIAGGVERFLELAEIASVAIVGTRHPSQDGAAVAESLGRGLSASGVAVMSGMALGIDSAAHEGAIAGGGVTLAVLPTSVVKPYPASKRRLFARVLEAGGVGVGELGLQSAAHRWTFIARNRLIAALSNATVVVEARHGSGSEVTVRVASDLGRLIGAVPGSVMRPQCDGPNDLLAHGASVVRDAQDVLDLLYGVGTCTVEIDDRPEPSARQTAILAAVGSGAGSLAELERAGIDSRVALVEISALELSGHLKRTNGGGLFLVP